ncbi:MAG: ubiquitin-like small modifier protein 1 [Candidatus Thorarchaeota archaeon]
MTTVFDKPKIIKVTVRFFATFKQITNQRDIEFSIEEGATIQQLLNVVFNQFQTLRNKIFDENNELRPWIHILKNGRNIKFLNGIETKTTNGDIIALFPPVAGG